jgi:carboxymethylenebutenolidase
MKHLVLTYGLFFLVTFVSAQSIPSCCQAPSATAAFASLGSDVNFQNAHASPVPMEYAAIGNMITFKTPDGKTSTAYFLPAKQKSKNYLIVFHEWWGLNGYIKKVSDMLSDSLPNVNIMAVDLYDGKVATNSDEAKNLMQASDADRSKAIINGAIGFAGKDARIATVGWCFGGGWSMQGALLAGNQLAGCVIYYGMPETDVARLKTLNADVLFIWANKDEWINEKVKDEFVQNMKTAGKNLTVKEYPADHAFANPSNPKYDKESGDDAWKNATAFLRKSFAK